MVKYVLVPVADGTEDIELSCITDTLVRAGVEVVVASVMGRREVTLARKLQLIATTKIEELGSAPHFDAIVVPGGMPGAQHIANNKRFVELLKGARSAGVLCAAICAAPVIVFAPHGILDGIPSATCFPALRAKMPIGTLWSSHSVACHKNVLTSQGPGTSLAFALHIVCRLCGPEKAREIAAAMLVPIPTPLCCPTTGSCL